MKCMYCGAPDSRVMDSRPTDEGTVIRRRRECVNCGRRFTTYEKIESVPLMVVKRNGSRQLFDIEKVRGGIIKACEKCKVSAEQMEALHIKKCETLEEMLPVCDVLSIHTPKRPDTVNLINRDSFAKMKPTAILINTARGGIVNEADLAEALKNHQIAGAALDVFDPEPPALDNPLFQLDNVLLTPHIGAATDGAMQNMARACAQNIIDYFGGKRPGFVVNPEIYVPISENPKA